MTQVELATAMRASRTVVHRLLDPNTSHVTALRAEGGMPRRLPLLAEFGAVTFDRVTAGSSGRPRSLPSSIGLGAKF